MSSPERWLVSYDISDDRARRDVDRHLGGIGERVLYSAFDLHVSEPEVSSALDALSGRLGVSDSLIANPRCPACASHVHGVLLGRHADWYVG